MVDEFDAVKSVLDDIKVRAEESGYVIDELEAYFPRRVKDYQGLQVELEQDPELNRKYRDRVSDFTKKNGREPSQAEREKIANSVLRGFYGKTNISTPAGVKKRSIKKVGKSMNDFYFDSPNALYMHIHQMNEAIEGRKAIGAGATLSNDMAVPEESIAKFVTTLMDNGTISASQQSELEGLIRSRFRTQPLSSGVMGARNAILLTSIGDFSNAITQLADIQWAAYQGGLYETLRAVSKKINPRKGSEYLTKEDAGIDSVLEELSGDGGLGKALDTVLSSSLFKAIDSAGKETLINSVMSRIKKEVKRGKLSAKTEDLINGMFTDDAEKQRVLNAIKNDTLDDKTKQYIAFFTLSEYQPISKMEVPQKYLDSDAGRLAYTLKTFTIKQLSVIRNQAIKKIADGDVKTGMKNLLHLATIMMLANASKDEIKDVILGRETQLSDLVFENILSLMGLSRFAVQRGAREGLGKMAVDIVAPPTSFITDLQKDVFDIVDGDAKQFDDFRLVKYIPVAGDLLYYRYGRGKKMEKKYRNSDTAINQLLKDVGIK